MEIVLKYDNLECIYSLSKDCVVSPVSERIFLTYFICFIFHNDCFLNL